MPDLGFPIFDPLLKYGDIVELYGEEGVGKSEMMLNIVVTVILPPRWGRWILGGLGLGVLLLDTGLKFSLVRLGTLLELRIRHHVGLQTQPQDGSAPEDARAMSTGLYPCDERRHEWRLVACHGYVVSSKVIHID